MLTMYPSTSAADVKKYFTAADYYSEGQETIGQWGGTLAERLGLSGTVDKASFDRLCDNLHPVTGKRLTPRTNEERRVGYDFVFSGPKSFSIVEALATDEERQRLLGAFDAAINETMIEAERDMQTRVRIGGADYDRPTGSMVWASFDHSTSRPVELHELLARYAANDNMPHWLRAMNDNVPPDPHRHRHVYCFNVTFDPVERRYKAGEFSYIKRDGEYYRAAFYSRLAARLEAMGYVIDRRGGTEWEIAGVPQSVIDTFSKRTDHIDAKAEELGITNDERKAELGAKTRAKKQKELTQPELRNKWDAQLTPAEREALAAVYAREINPSPEVTAAQAVRYAIDHCTEQLSVERERELRRVALLRGLGHVLPEELSAEMTRQGVLLRQVEGTWWATTSQLMREEDKLVGFAAGGRGTVTPVGVPNGLERGTLSDGQWRATVGLLNSSNRVNLLEGPAGAGKSYSLKAYDQGMRLAGQTVTYLATTSDAVGVLASGGFEVNTVARFLLDPTLQESARSGTVVCDEVSMLGHKDAVKLVSLAEKLDLRLLFTGDQFQHGSVPRGALLHLLKNYSGITPFRLEEIRRQEDADYKAAVKSLSEGNTLEGFNALDRKEWVKEIANEQNRYTHLAADYVQALADKKTVLVVSPTHAEAAKITTEIRRQLRAADKLGKEEHPFIRLVAANASEAERGRAETYRIGDVVCFHQNAKGFTKGDRLVVTDPAQVPLAEAGKFQLYRPKAISLAVGDKLRFTSTVKTLDNKHTLKNGMVKTVAGFDSRGNIKLDNNWTVAKDAGHFRMGWVDTSFAAQGKTVQRVLLGMAAGSAPAMSQENFYVSASRGKEKMTLYTDSKDAVREAVQRSSSKLAALDLRAKPQPKLVDRLRKLLERRRRYGVVQRMRAAWDGQSRSSSMPPRTPPRTPSTHRERVDERQVERDCGRGR